VGDPHTLPRAVWPGMGELVPEIRSHGIVPSRAGSAHRRCIVADDSSRTSTSNTQRARPTCSMPVSSGNGVAGDRPIDRRSGRGPLLDSNYHRGGGPIMTQDDEPQGPKPFHVPDALGHALAWGAPLSIVDQDGALPPTTRDGSRRRSSILRRLRMWISRRR
jgi:hypothetical protein